MRKHLRPYVMPGPPRPTKRRATIVDPPDRRLQMPWRSISGSHTARPPVVPIELVPTDRILLRWSRSIGDGLPSDEWDDTRAATVPELDSESAIVVDWTVTHAPSHVGEVIKLWYKTPVPVIEIAHDLGINSKLVRPRWLAALSWMRPEFARYGLL